MAYSIPTGNNPMEVLVSVLSQIPLLSNGILILVFLGIASSGYYAQERKTGRGNFPMWASISSLITTISAFVLFLYQGIVALPTIIIFISLTLVCAIWFFLNREDNIF